MPVRARGLQYNVQVRQEENLSYSWEFNDGKGWASLLADTNVYKGYNTGALTIKIDEPTGRQYRAKVNNGNCPIYSNPVTFTKLREIVITQQPISYTICSGNGKGLKYSVQADGDDLAYEWEFKDPNMTTWVSFSNFADTYPDYTTATLTANGVETPGRQYRVKIINDCGMVYSESATFTLTTAPPTITQQPQSRTACSDNGKGLTYSVQAIGDNLAYGWEFKDPTATDWTSLGGQYADLYPGYDKPTLTTNGTEANGRQYRVKIMNSCGSTVYSQAATLTLAPALNITQQPQSRIACSNSTNGLTYTVVVESTVPVTYEWEFKDPTATDWTSLGGQYADRYPGYDKPTLTTNGTEANGRQYRVKVMNGTCTVYSQAATLTLIPTPTITQQPQSRTACSSKGLKYEVKVDGDVIGYAWEYNDGKGWIPLGPENDLYSGIATAILTTNGEEPDGRQYRVSFGYSCNIESSQPATFTRSPTPIITQQPISRTACSGKGLKYEVIADGTGLTYEWEYNDGGDWASLSTYSTSYPGYNTATLTTNGDEPNGRQYRVKITSGPCTVYSEAATFIQTQCTPTLTNFSVSPQSVVPGQSIEFTATVGGVTGPYNYTLSNGAGSTQTGRASSSSFSQRLTAQGTGLQTYTLTIGNSPYSVIGTVSITVGSFAITGLTARANPVQSGQSVEFTAVFEGLTEADFYSYTLTNGQERLPLTGNFHGSLFRESITARGAGVQLYTLTVATYTKGTATTTISITVIGDDVGLERFAISGVKDVSCETLGENQRQVQFTPQYAGTNDEPISFSVVNELLPTTQSGPYTLRLYTDNPVITLVARQGNTEAKYTYNWLANCSTSSGGLSITGAQMVNCQLEDAANSKRYKVSLQPQYAGQDNTQPISFSIVNELSPTTAPGPYTLYLWGDNPVITLVARQGSAETKYAYNWLVSCPTSSSGFALRGAEVIDCQLEDAANSKRYKVSLQPQYTGQNNTQPISFSIVNELSPTTAPGPYTLYLWGDNPVITLVARQGSAETKYAYNWLANCHPASTARRAAPADIGAGMQVRLLGNPVTNHQIRVEVKGVEGQSVDLTLRDITGRQLTCDRIERADRVEQLNLETSPAWGGVLLLRVRAGSHQQTIKVIQNP